MTDYAWRRDGDEFTYTWQSAGVAIGVNQLHEARGELYGELWVSSSLPDVPSHVHWGRLNLSSASTRDKLCALLQKRLKLDGDRWPKMLESVCTRTAVEWRRGEPIVDLATAGAPEPSRFLVPKLLPSNASTIFYGDGSSCKSLLAMLVAIGVRTGARLPYGISAVETGEVLYLDWESDIDDQKERIRAFTLGLGLEDVPRIHYRRQFRSITEDAAHLRAEVSRLGIKLVIVDSLGPAVGASLRDEQEAIPAMNAIRSLGTTALVLAHITKAEARGDTTQTMPLGSIMFRNMARSTWEVRKSETGSEDIQTVAIYHKKMNRGPRQATPFGFQFHFFNQSEALEMLEVTAIDVAEDDDLAQHAPLHYRLRQALKTGGKSLSDLAKTTGAKEDTVRRTLNRMGDATCIAGAKGQSGFSMWGLKVAS